MTLDFVRIFMLVNQLGSVICELCACVYVYVCIMRVCVLVWNFRWDPYVSHMMVVIGDRHARFLIS